MTYLKVLLFAVALPVAALAAIDTNSQHFYLFTYFLNSYDQGGARIAVSSDAVNWQIINDGNPVIVPVISTEHRMRDPYIYYDTCSGVFHLVWTTGWTQKTIGYAESKDLIKWSIQYAVPVGEDIPNCACCWAPQVFFDDRKDSCMIYWSTERGTSGKRSYYCMTKDFREFSDSRLFFDPGYSVIDDDLIKVDDTTYYMFFKDEREPYQAGTQSKNLHHVHGPTPQGPWSIVSPWITTPGCEGPSSIKIGSEYLIYFDPYIDFSSTYRVVKVTDLTTTPSAQGWPQGAVLKTTTGSNFLFSHGHIIEIPRAKVMQLLYGRTDNTSYPCPWDITYKLTPDKYPLGERNCGCGTGVGLAFIPPVFFKVIAGRRKRKTTDCQR